MTARDGRGGARVPDGVPRPASIPFAQGPNRSDLAALPGTPGTTLPGPSGSNPAVPPLGRGDAGEVRRTLSQIPLDSLNAGSIAPLGQPTQFPNEPITSGIGMGAGPGTESMIPPPNRMSQELSAQQVRGWYPMLMRLASLPNATTQTKILAQRLRGQLGIRPHQIPKFPGEA